MSKWILIAALSSINAVAIPEPETKMGFDEALTKIIERSTTVDSQKAKFEGTKSRNIPSKLSMLPTISLEASKYRRLEEGKTDENQGFIEGQAKLNILKFGADAAAMKAASRENSAQEKLVDDAILKAESEAMDALVDRVQSDLELQIRKKMVEVQNASLEIAKQRFRQGLLAAQEVDKVEVDLQNARASVSDSEIRNAQARAKLTALLGTDALVIAWPWMDELKQPPPELGNPEDRLKERPDWQAAELSLAAQNYRADEKLGKVYPSLDLGFSYGYGQRYAGEKIGPSWEGRLSLTIPLFDKLENYSAYEAQVHAKRGSEVALEQVRRNALSEWNSSKAAYQYSVATAQSRDQTVITARKLYKDNVTRFQKGLVSANDLTVDQDRLAETELFAVKGWASAHLALTKFCHSAGFRLQDCRKQPRKS